MNFFDFYSQIEEVIELRNEAERIRDRWDDCGAIPGCDCGCGGDMFDWEGQSEAFEEANDLEREAEELYCKLQDKFEALTK